MSFDARNNSAVQKRAEQLKRWEDSDTNRASNMPKDPATRKVKFSSGCVFLAACLSGDKDEILRLIECGVDIDTANVDGLTALHQVNYILFFCSSIIQFCVTCVYRMRLCGGRSYRGDPSVCDERSCVVSASPFGSFRCCRIGHRTKAVHLCISAISCPTVLCASRAPLHK